jgi:hypothetical protein
MAALDDRARPMEMAAEVAALDFFDDFSDRSGRKSSMAAGSGGSVRLNSPSSHGAGGGDGAR